MVVVRCAACGRWRARRAVPDISGAAAVLVAMGILLARVSGDDVGPGLVLARLEQARRRPAARAVARGMFRPRRLLLLPRVANPPRLSRAAHVFRAPLGALRAASRWRFLHCVGLRWSGASRGDAFVPAARAGCQAAAANGGLPATSSRRTISVRRAALLLADPCDPYARDARRQSL